MCLRGTAGKDAILSKPATNGTFFFAKKKVPKEKRLKSTPLNSLASLVAKSVLLA
jgi:hypothetical protein